MEKDILQNRKQVRFVKKISKNLLDSSLKMDSEKIDFLIEHPSLRKIGLKTFEKVSKQNTLTDKRFPVQVQMDKFYMLRAIVTSVNKALDKVAENPKLKKVLLDSLIPNLIEIVKSRSEKIESFKEKYGFNPPGFLTVSPGKFCNLKCTGCYASSTSSDSEKLDYDVLDRIITEKTESWGSWFTVISGGEPLCYKSQGKTIIDLAKKHQNNYFLMYTNGILIDKKMANKLAEVDNITPAISVEGFKEETDAQRGKGIYQKILKAFENLNEVGVPFGISLTATKDNAELITSKKLMDYYFNKGALYAWIFQLMPIGRAKDLDIMITPEQRLKMFYQTKNLIKDHKYFVADFWNSGAVSDGCISAGKLGGGGYLYIEWNGNITPCVFNPYSSGNINEIYKNGGSINDVLKTPFFKKIREWQGNYALNKKPNEMGNLILPCPIRDHYEDMVKLLNDCHPTPIDAMARKNLKDKEYKGKLIKYDEELAKILNPVWERQYLYKNENQTED